MKVDLRPFSLSLERPLSTASGSIERRDGFLVDLRAEGVRGVGEAAPLPGWTESYGACRGALEAAVERLADRAPDATGADRGAVLPDWEDAPAAAHGVDLALADLHGRRAGEPLYRHLGAPERVDAVPANAVVDDGPTEETVAAAAAAVADGFGCLKLKVGTDDVADDVSRLAAVRDAIGPEATIRADANGAWSREEAERAFDALSAVGVEYVEQPLTPWDLEGHASLRGGRVDVAIDETLASRSPEEVLEAGAADVLVVKPMVLGGPHRAASVADLAREAGVGVVVTTTVDGVVGRTGAAHLAASLPDPAPAGVATGDRLAEDLAPDPVAVAGGRASIPQAPGHGVELEEGTG